MFCCRAPSATCQRGRWSPWTGLTLRLSLWPSPPRRSRVRPRRPCPPRARSIGISRSLTANHGRSRTDLTCAIGVGSRPSGLPGRASKLGTGGATSGPHPGHERPDRSGQHRSSIGRASAQLTRHTPPPAAGRCDPSLALPDTEEVTPSPVMPTPSRTSKTQVARRRSTRPSWRAHPRRRRWQDRTPGGGVMGHTWGMTAGTAAVPSGQS